MRRLVAIASLSSCLLLPLVVLGQSLTNADVLRLLEAGLSADVIFAKIKSSVNVWKGAESGAPPKSVRNVTYEKLAPGVYRVTPETPLAAGEYGFYYAGSAPMATYGMAAAGSGNKIFAFGID